MEKYEKNGSVLYILNVLKKYSDEEHLLSSNKISELIEKDYKVKLDSRKIRRDINLLIENFGYDIETFKENNIGYCIKKDPDKDFELGELSAIIDTFSYSNFLPDKLSNSIVKKCLSKMNIYEQKDFNDYKASIKNTKTSNQEIINNIELINEAISNGKKITFDYYKYNIGKNSKIEEEKVIPKLPYKVSPYKITYNLQKLYLYCLKDGMKEIIKYRLDRMKNVNVLKDKSNDKYLNEVDYYIKNNVAEYTGDMEHVTIECDMSLLDTVIETFGKDIKFEYINENKFKVSFYTVIEGFKFWCLRNLENVKVIEPISLNKKIKQIIKNYE